MRACFGLVFLTACGGSVSPTPDAAAPDSAVTTDPDSGDPVFDLDASADVEDATPMIPTPNGSILALASSGNSWSVVRVTLPTGTVTTLFPVQTSFQPTAIAMRPDGDIDRFDFDGTKTHVIAVSKSTGVQVGAEALVDGRVEGADYAPNKDRWATVWGSGLPRLVKIDAMGNVTTISKQPGGVMDLGVMGNVVMTLLCHCGEDLYRGGVGAFSIGGANLGDIVWDMDVWDAMAPMGSYLVLAHHDGSLQVLDPKSQLFSAKLQTTWHFADATEDF